MENIEELKINVEELLKRETSLKESIHLNQVLKVL